MTVFVLCCATVAVLGKGPPKKVEEVIITQPDFDTPRGLVVQLSAAPQTLSAFSSPVPVLPSSAESATQMTVEQQLAAATEQVNDLKIENTALKTENTRLLSPAGRVNVNLKL
jgi:hypothetical protein